LLTEGMAPEAALAAMGTSRWAMADALAVLDGEYGGVEAYLRGQAGMAAEVLDRLRSELVV
jgi:Tyrosine phosphatase family